MRVLLEIACFSPEDAVTAAGAGADRIELCRAYDVGGLTPSVEDLAFVKERVQVPVFVMIRERPGDFLYQADEHARMLESTRAMLEHGADGIVFGAMTTKGRIDEVRVKDMVEAVAPVPLTFHRAFDDANNQSEALDVLKRCRVARVLTSAGQPTALEGADSLARLVVRASDELIVVPGGSIRSANVDEILKRSGAAEIHSAARTSEPRVDAAEVTRLASALA